MTDWEKQLTRRAATLKRDKEALERDVAAARLDGKSFRDIGTWAGINHESARKICQAISGHTRTRAEMEQTA